MSVDWKKNAAASLFKVHVNGYVYFFNPKSAKNLTAMLNISHWNEKSRADDLFKAVFKYAGVHESPVSHFGLQRWAFLFHRK